MRSIQNRVGIWQLATGKNKEELSEILGISKSAFYAKLSGVSEFTLTEARKLANVFGCSVDQLFVDPVEDYVKS